MKMNAMPWQQGKVTFIYGRAINYVHVETHERITMVVYKLNAEYTIFQTYVDTPQLENIMHDYLQVTDLRNKTIAEKIEL